VTGSQRAGRQVRADIRGQMGEGMPGTCPLNLQQGLSWSQTPASSLSTTHYPLRTGNVKRAMKRARKERNMSRKKSRPSVLRALRTRKARRRDSVG
jgi:hypothetical protein